MSYSDLKKSINPTIMGKDNNNNNNNDCPIIVTIIAISDQLGFVRVNNHLTLDEAYCFAASTASESLSTLTPDPWALVSLPPPFPPMVEVTLFTQSLAVRPLPARP